MMTFHLYTLKIDFIYRVQPSSSSFQTKSDIILDTIDVLGLRECTFDHLFPGIQVKRLTAFVLHEKLVESAGLQPEYPTYVCAVEGLTGSI
jgi:hypothetical protein